MPASINNGNNNSSIWKSSKAWLVNYASLMNMPSWFLTVGGEEEEEEEEEEDGGWGAGRDEGREQWSALTSEHVLWAGSEASARRVLLITVTPAPGNTSSPSWWTSGTLSICKHDKTSVIRRQPWPARCPPSWNCQFWGKRAGSLVAWCEYISRAAGEGRGQAWCSPLPDTFVN